MTTAGIPRHNQATVFPYDPQPWAVDALCAQIGESDAIFFPEMGGSTTAAKRICRRCPVAAQCLQYALQHREQFGVWGMTSPNERQRLGRRAAA
jgi:WhiB family redox-sensing transcriptional regulator